MNQYVKLIEIVEQKPTTPKRENTLVEKEELDTRVVFYGMTEDADEKLPEYRVSAHVKFHKKPHIKTGVERFQRQNLDLSPQPM